MQTPEKMHGMPHKGIRIVDRHRTAPNHTNLSIFKWSAEILKSKGVWNDVSSNEHNNRADCFFEKQVNRRGFTFTFLLDIQADTWLLLCQLSYYRNSAISTSACNNNHFFN